MRAVNLLPPDERQAKSLKNEDPAIVVGSAAGLVVLIALSLGFFLAHSNASAQQQKLDAARLELGKLSLVKPKPVKVPKSTRPIIPIPAVTSEQTPLMQAVSGALSYRIAWDRILREFSLVVPDDITVTSMVLTAPPTVAAAPGSSASAPTGLTLAGTAYSQDSVARLMSRLMLIPDLSDVTLMSSTGGAGTPQLQFSIVANVKGAPVAPAPVVPTTPTDTSTTTGSSS
ncbi:MAG TPA: PilN domain-containing protein [Gaiellaceae bacterium]|nr:PilN domain-containing protein [Gaiellaceae bacterium]